MRQRIQAVVLAAVMLLGIGVGTLQVMAAGTITVSRVSGVKGELVDVTISLTSEDVDSGNFDARYDASALELISAEATTDFQCIANPYEEGRVRVSFMRLTPITDDVLCTLTFRVTEDTSDDGSAVVLEQVKLYGNDAVVAANVIQGSVARKTVSLSMKTMDTAMYQAVGAVVELGGTLAPAGGNFSVAYDPSCFEVRSVLPLEAANNAFFEYNVIEPGLVRVAFSSDKVLDAGQLCSIVFEAVGNAGSSSELVVTNVQMYDENSDLLDVSVVNGELNIVVPSDDDPKLWLVGGAIEGDGAKTAVVLQGRGYACGGNFTLMYDSSMTAEVQASIDCQINHDADAGTIKVSWASAAPYSGETEMLTITFANAVESTIGVQDVKLYFAESDPIPVVDVRPGRITETDVVTVVVDEAVVETNGAMSTYTVAVDVADMSYFTDAPMESITPMLALYENGRMVGLDMQEVADFSGGVNEIELSVESDAAVSNISVFLLEGNEGMVPVTSSLEIVSAEMKTTT